jgi:hypothetical protein
LTTDNPNKWLTLAANVGVIFGLILLAYEIRQTNSALDRDYDVFLTDVQGRAREGWREFNGRIIESDDVADIWMRGNAGDELSPKEEVRYRYLANDFIILYQLQFEQYKIVGRDIGEITSWLDTAFVNRPGLQKHLARIIGHNPDSEFSRSIRELYPELP